MCFGCSRAQAESNLIAVYCILVLFETNVLFSSNKMRSRNDCAILLRHFGVHISNNVRRLGNARSSEVSTLFSFKVRLLLCGYWSASAMEDTKQYRHVSTDRCYGVFFDSKVISRKWCNLSCYNKAVSSDKGLATSKVTNLNIARNYHFSNDLGRAISGTARAPASYSGSNWCLFSWKTAKDQKILKKKPTKLIHHLVHFF